MSLIIENNNRHEHNGNGITIDPIVSNTLNAFSMDAHGHGVTFRGANCTTISFVDHGEYRAMFVANPSICRSNCDAL